MLLAEGGHEAGGRCFLGDGEAAVPGRRLVGEGEIVAAVPGRRLVGEGERGGEGGLEGSWWYSGAQLRSAARLSTTT